MMKQFRKDPRYLTRYQMVCAGVILVANLILLVIRPPNWWQLALFVPSIVMLGSTKIEWVISGAISSMATAVYTLGFDPMIFLYVPAAFMLALCFSGLIHCASHASIRPKFLNRPVGELMGFLQLSGFADWKIIHVIHHVHTDDPELDPHPPMQKGYWEYTRGMRQSIANAYLRYYFKTFGQNSETVNAVKQFVRASRVAHLGKVVFWFLLLQPQLFAFLFATSIVFKMFQFSLLNWAAHRPSGDKVEIRNLNHGWFWLANYFSFGLYVHKNHHLAPHLFNPKSMTKNSVLPAEVEKAA